MPTATSARNAGSDSGDQGVGNDQCHTKAAGAVHRDVDGLVHNGLHGAAWLGSQRILL